MQYGGLGCAASLFSCLQASSLSPHATEQGNLTKAISEKPSISIWRSFGPSAPRRVKRYEPTDEGKKYFQQVSVVLGQSAGFCYGDKTVDSIVKWTDPVTMGASFQTEVTYTYKIANFAPWAQRSDVQREFGDVRTSVNGISKSNEIAGLQLTNQGWEVPGQ
jgi:hypothetical protein